MITTPTQKDNKLIAEFMGLDIITDGISLFDTTFKSLKKYNEDWNELMPVIYKIESLGLNIPITIYWHSTIIGNQSVALGYYNKGDRLENTYKAVVEFIKWYNENKSK